MGSSWCRPLLFGSFLPQLIGPGESLKGTAVLAVSLATYITFWKFRDECHYPLEAHAASPSPTLRGERKTAKQSVNLSQVEMLVECDALKKGMLCLLQLQGAGDTGILDHALT